VVAGLLLLLASTDLVAQARPTFRPHHRLRRAHAPQQRLRDPEQILPLTIGRFKTPTLRDLGHSQPYLHTGRMDSIERVLDFYRHTALLAQAGKLRNADPNLAEDSIDTEDSAAPAAFFRNLNEDYD
jgi:hypothetical protein